MSEKELKLNDQLAIDRTRFAAERNLMAWIRTSLSMIAFGFTIYKFLQMMHEQSPVPDSAAQCSAQRGAVAPRHRHLRRRGRLYSTRQDVRKLSPDTPFRLWDLASIVAILIGLLGILIFASMVYTSGPFG